MRDFTFDETVSYDELRALATWHREQAGKASAQAAYHEQRTLALEAKLSPRTDVVHGAGCR